MVLFFYYNDVLSLSCNGQQRNINEKKDKRLNRLIKNTNIIKVITTFIAAS